MKKLKAILALVLVLSLMTGLLAACADSGNGNTNTNTNSGANSNGDAADSNKDADDGGIPDEEPAELEFWFYCNSKWKDEESVTNPVLEKINEILLEKVNATINWTLLQPSDYKDKVGLALGGGERIDILAVMPVGRVSNWYNQGMLMDLTELLPEYAPDALALCEGLTGGYMFNGGLYGLPTLRNLPSFTVTYFSTDLLEQVGMVEKFRNMQTFDEFEEVLEALTALVPDGVYPMGSSFTGFGGPTLLNSRVFDEIVTVETVGDATSTLFVEDGTVKMIQADERYEAKVKMIRDWFDRGYIWPDSLYNTTMQQDDLMKQGVIAGVFNGSEYGVETIKENLLGYELELRTIGAPVIGAANAALWGVSLPVTCEEPEAACRFINELYTNAELMNLFIHGVDYEIVDGQVQYPTDETPYYANGQHIIGNALLSLPILGQGADYFDVVKELNDTADKSAYMGFTINTEELQLMISNISAVKDQYNQTISSGGYTEEMYQEFVSKLNAAGWDEYGAAVQAQLDAFIAANP